MTREKYKKFYFSRRDFLKTISWTPAIYLTHAPFQLLSGHSLSKRAVPFRFSETRLNPRYPTKSALDDLLLQIAPGGDEYVSEKNAYEITDLLSNWSRQLTSTNGSAESLKTFAHEQIEFTSLTASQDVPVRSADTIQITRRKFSASRSQGRDPFLREVQSYLASLGRI